MMADPYTQRLATYRYLQARQQAAMQQRAMQEREARMRADMQQRGSMGQQRLGFEQQRLNQGAQGQSDTNARFRAQYEQNERFKREEANRRAGIETRAALDARRGRLQPGNRWRADDATQQELIPGGKEYAEFQTKHAKDINTLRSVDSSTKELVGVINYITDPKNKQGFASNFGGWNAYVTRLLPNIIPGFSHTSDVGAAVDRLQEMAEISGLSQVRGQAGQSVGQITEREWPKFASQLLKLNPRVDEDTARMWLKQFKQNALDIRNRELETYKDTWKEKPFMAKDPLAYGARPSATVNPAEAQGGEVPPGISPDDWKYVTPAEKAQWRTPQPSQSPQIQPQLPQ